MILERSYRRDRLAPRLNQKVEYKVGELQGQEEYSQFAAKSNLAKIKD